MFNLDEENIKGALGNKEFYVWQGKKPRMLGFYLWLAAFICLWFLPNWNNWSNLFIIF